LASTSPARCWTAELAIRSTSRESRVASILAVPWNSAEPASEAVAKEAVGAVSSWVPRATEVHAFTVTRGGIYFIAQSRLQYFDLSTGISKTILTIGKPVTEG
jgi:hypothetical protein